MGLHGPSYHFWTMCTHWSVYFFMCDFIDTIKVYQAKLYHFYTNPYTKINDSTFDELNDFEMLVDKNLPTSSRAYLNGEKVDYFMIEFAGFKILYQSMLPRNKWNEANVEARLPSCVGSCEKKSSRLFQMFHSRVT